MSNYNLTLQSNNTDLQAILNTINELPEAVEQATPVISVNNSNGLITAVAGTKTSTHQLAFQPAKTITPSTASQIAVSSGYYTGGNVTVAGDANLVAGNIKSGVSIFGVSGNYAGSGGGDASAEDGIITKTISSYTNDRVTSIGNSVFYSCYSLTTVNFPKVTTIGSYAFYDCSRLTTASFPVATTIGSGAFYSCSRLTTASFPKVTSIGNNAFYRCSRLTTASFPVATSIGNYAFYSCSSLTTASFPVATTIGSGAFSSCSKLTSIDFPSARTIGSNAFASCSSLSAIHIGTAGVCTLANSNAFSNTGIWSNKGSIYVPNSLLSSYKTATNWAFFKSRIYTDPSRPY